MRPPQIQTDTCVGFNFGLWAIGREHQRGSTTSRFDKRQCNQIVTVAPQTLCVEGNPSPALILGIYPPRQGGAKQGLGDWKAPICQRQKSATIKHPIYFDNSKNHDTYHPKNILQPTPIRVSLFLDWHSTSRHRRVAAL